MPIPASSLQQISQAFFNLYNENLSEIDNLYETIKSSLDGITQTADYLMHILPTPEHFEDDRIISSIDALFLVAKRDANVAGKVLYIRWYYHMVLFAMGSMAVKNVVEYIKKKTGKTVRVKTIGNNFSYALDGAAKFSIVRATGGGAFSTMYSGFALYSPIWEDILEVCVHTEGGEESLMRLEMPGAFEVFTDMGSSDYLEDHVPLTDFGKLVKEHFIDKIKQLIANQ